MSTVKSDSGREAAPPNSSSGAFTLAHISDPHLSSLDTVRRRDLINKRILGYLSWRSHRNEEHQDGILAAMVNDLRHANPDHIAITGDMTHLGLPSEFLEVSGWLQKLGPPEKITLVPGNHDTYVREPWNYTFAHWLPYMVSDSGAVPWEGDRGEDIFPSLRIRGRFAIIGLSSARPSAPFLAVGSLGKLQLRRLEQLLEETAQEGLLRILLIHHPPLATTVGWRKSLTDGHELRALLSRAGVELILHGHAHRPAHALFEMPRGKAPVIGVPSASAAGTKPGRDARYHIYRLAKGEDGWELHTTVRAYMKDQGRFAAAGKGTLSLPRPHLVG